jgi:hypothetical protein
MEIDLQLVLQYLIYPVMLVAGWFLKSMWAAIGQLRKDLAELQLAISENYVKKSDLDHKFDLIMAELREMRDIIRGKVDKS